MSETRALKVLFAACVFVAPLLFATTAFAADQSACIAADAGDNRHPSGNDRSCENGSLGRSQSDPDGTSNGGADKPGGTGGIDRADQDFNNGCGNDDDFEDDNNGNCGGREKELGAVTLAKPTRTKRAALGAEAKVAGDTSVRAAPRTIAETVTKVLGERIVAPVRSALATTGSIALLLLASAAGALTLGAAMRDAGRPRS